MKPCLVAGSRIKSPRQNPPDHNPPEKKNSATLFRVRIEDSNRNRFVLNGIQRDFFSGGSFPGGFYPDTHNHKHIKIYKYIRTIYASKTVPGILLSRTLATFGKYELNSLSTSLSVESLVPSPFTSLKRNLSNFIRIMSR